MKRILSLLLLLFATFVYGENIKVQTKGDVYIKLSDDEIVKLSEEDEITDEDVIIVGEKSILTFYVDGQKTVIRKAGVYSIKNILKNK